MGKEGNIRGFNGGAVSAEAAFSFKCIERLDPQIRGRVRRYLDDILSRPDFQQPANAFQVNRVYSRLKEKTMTQFVEAGLVPVMGQKKGYFKLDSIGIATLLYLYDHGKPLASRVRKDVRRIAEEELARKRVEEARKKAEEARKKALSTTSGRTLAPAY